MLISSPALAASGQTIYRQACASCHGNQAQGLANMQAPRLAGQHDWYIENQIVDIRDKRRTNGSSGVMVGLFRALSKEDIKALSKYLEELE